MKRIGLPFAAILTTLAFTLSACGGAPSKDELAEQLVDDAGLTEEQADCVAEKVLDSDLSDEQLDALDNDSDDSGLSADDEAEVIEVVGTATTECVTEEE